MQDIGVGICHKKIKKQKEYGKWYRKDQYQNISGRDKKKES